VKLRCERDDLVEALGTAGRAVANRGGALPVLSGVRMELVGDTLSLTGSDLDLTISVTATVSGSADGVAVVPAKIASDVVRSLDAGRVELSVEGDEAQITSGRFSSSIRLLPADEFPRQAPPAEHAVTLDAGDLSSALSQVVPAASSDDARPILTGVLMAAEDGGLRLVATDSYRLAVRDLDWTWKHEPTTALVPSRALSEAARALAGESAVELSIEPHQITFSGGGRRLTSRLVEGEFPPFRNLIPSGYDSIATIERQTLLDALKQVAPYGQNNNPVRLSFDREHLQVDGSLQDVGRGAAAIDVKYEGEALTVAFNPTYLSDGVNAVEDNEVMLEVRDGLKPALVHGNERHGFLYLLMPVRLPA
jgi:DNA polymerase III subunit beta